MSRSICVEVSREFVDRRFSLRGFTLVELLVVIAVIAILAGMLLPVIFKAKLKTQGIQCMNGHRQLTLAWIMYNNDHEDRILYSSPNNWITPESTNYSWILGLMNFDTNNPSNWDINQDIVKSPLWPYCGNSAEIWRCPADKSTISVNGQNLPRVRSMSMNVWLGGFGGNAGGLSQSDSSTMGGNVWRIYLKMSDFTDPGPVNTFVFLDMREDSIDIGNFAPNMNGWPDQPGQLSFYDLPGSYHHRAGGLSFADGHSEIKPWKDARTMPNLVSGGLLPDQYSSPGNQDIMWLQAHSTRRIQ